MKYIKVITLLLSILLLGCNQKDKKTKATKEQSTVIAADDKEKLQHLVRQLYKWHETKSSNHDFDPIADNQDSIYVGLDLKKHEQRIVELKQTGFFDNQFIDNYNTIALTIDKGLRNKKLEYLVGELPPYGNDANPWCNCQDAPDNYWQKIKINNITFDNTTATFSWSWGENFNYKVKAVKLNNNWKISYLQGFDIKEFFPR